MIKIIGLTIVALSLFVVIATGVHAQTATPTTTPTTTTTTTTTPTTTTAPTATPTGSVQGTSTVTVPSGAPATGFGK